MGEAVQQHDPGISFKRAADELSGIDVVFIGHLGPRGLEKLNGKDIEAVHYRFFRQPGNDNSLKLALTYKAVSEDLVVIASLKTATSSFYSEENKISFTDENGVDRLTGHKSLARQVVLDCFPASLDLIEKFIGGHFYIDDPARLKEDYYQSYEAFVAIEDTARISHHHCNSLLPKTMAALTHEPYRPEQAEPAQTQELVLV